MTTAGARLRGFRNAVALAAATLLIVALPPVRFLTKQSAATAGIDAYRYRFERAARGSVRRALENEIAFYQERLKVDPQGGLDRAFLARAYLKMARATGDLSWYLLAEQAARQSLANLSIQNDGALAVLARVAEARHDFAEALRLAGQFSSNEDALSIGVSSNLALGRVDEAARAADALVKQAPGLISHTLRALVDVAQGKDTEATQDFQQAIAGEEPGEVASSTWARTLFGRFHARRGRLALARDLYQEALAILPQYPLALVYLAELEARAGHYDAAAAEYADVVTVTASSPNVYDHVVLRGLSRIRDLQGDTDGARALWKQAEARLRRDVAEGTFGHRRELARLLLDHGQHEDVPESLALMRTEVGVRRDPETLDTLAWALSHAGRWQEAHEAMREALRWGFRDAALFYRAGTIEQALGNQTGARRFFRASQETDPTFDDQARRVLGISF